MKLVIALVGKPCSGKGTVALLLAHFFNDTHISAEHHRFSDPLNAILRHLALPRTRENLQKLPVALVQAFGPDVVTNALAYCIEHSNARVIILDGVRWDTDIAMVKRFPKHYVIAVDAPIAVRFARAQKRNRAGEAETTWDAFVALDEAPTESAIPRLRTIADACINNDADDAVYETEYLTLRKKLFPIFSNTLIPLLFSTPASSPTPQETPAQGETPCSTPPDSACSGG